MKSCVKHWKEEISCVKHWKEMISCDNYWWEMKSCVKHWKEQLCILTVSQLNQDYKQYHNTVSQL